MKCVIDVPKRQKLSCKGAMYCCSYEVQLLLLALAGSFGLVDNQCDCPTTWRSEIGFGRFIIATEQRR